MASFHKVIRIWKFKSAANLHCFQREGQLRETTEWDFAIECVLYRGAINLLQIDEMNGYYKASEFNIKVSHSMTRKINRASPGAHQKQTLYT